MRAVRVRAITRFESVPARFVTSGAGGLAPAKFCVVAHLSRSPRPRTGAVAHRSTAFPGTQRGSMSPHEGFTNVTSKAEPVAFVNAAPRVRLAYLDGLRALAASYVVGFHAVLGFGGGELTGLWRGLRRAFAFGHEAVAVFIVLSGYCLMLPVIRNQQSPSTVALGAFVRRRAFRILPPYFAALAYSLLLMASLSVLRRPHTGT